MMNPHRPTESTWWYNLHHSLSDKNFLSLFYIDIIFVLIFFFVKVLEFMCWADSDVLPASSTWVFPCMGIMQVIRESSIETYVNIFSKNSNILPSFYVFCKKSPLEYFTYLRGGQGWGAGDGARCFWHLGAGAAWRKKTGAGAAKKLAGSSALLEDTKHKEIVRLLLFRWNGKFLWWN